MIEKQLVKDFWEKASCGEDLYLKGFSQVDYNNQATYRYTLEPEILDFANFQEFRGKKTLEIGVGLGADHQKLAEAGADLFGIDLTERAINHTQRRLDLLGLKSTLQIGDAENLPFEDNFFDAVYSWGVLHHSPDTSKAIHEAYRVLKPGGSAKIMIYHKNSMVGFMLWMRFGLLRFKPFISWDTLYENFLESPGTKAYTRKEASLLFKDFQILNLDTPLNHADLLNSDVGQRHRGIFLRIAKKLWPRPLIKTFFPKNGIEMLIHCMKPF